jgi:phage-related protein
MSPWGEIELEPEVEDWYTALPEHERAIAARHIDRLGDRGVLLDEPHTRQLDGKLRELRFYIGTHLWRMTYYIATGRRIILLTVFPKNAATGAPGSGACTASNDAVH